MPTGWSPRFWLPSAAPAWDPAPWLADLGQIRAAIDHEYPNRAWLVGEREAPLDRWFSRTADAIRAARSDAEARRALDGLITRFQDGHAELHWPAGPAVSEASPAPAPTTIGGFCAARGFDAGQVTPGTAVALPGYHAFDGGGPFAAGLVASGKARAGVVRIGVFTPQGYPVLCEQAVAAARIDVTKPCDDACDDRLTTEAYARMTRGLMTTLDRLHAGGARVLLIDLTRNGGGSEWAEAAARIVSPVPLRSAAIGVLRGPAWVGKWRTLATTLRGAAPAAAPADRAMLTGLADQADAIAAAVTPCARPDCSGIVPTGYASGLVATAPAGRFAGRSWGPLVFSAAQFTYRDAVWRGPVIVLVDDETWSAAEEFAALLRDNDAGIVMGARTGGAGCGHLDGSAPIRLAHSGAELELPNCARFRKDGGNEVSEIVPDVPTGVRWNDGPAFAGRLTAAHLDEAIAQATALADHRSRPPAPAPAR